MANRIVLNTVSYHGKGAIGNIVPELAARGFQKAFVCSDPDLIRFNVTKKVTDLLDAAALPMRYTATSSPILLLRTFRQAWPRSERAGRTAS